MFHVTVSIVVCRVKTSATHQIVYYFSMEKVAKQNKREKILEKKSTTWRTRTKKTKHILKIILFSLRVLFASPKNTHNFIRVHFKRKTKNHF